MKFPQEESRAAALPIAMSARRTDKATRLCTAVRAHHEGEPIWTPEFQVAPPIAVLQLATGRWVAQIIGVAAELGLADEIQTGPKTAQEVAAAKGLHPDPLYRLLRALASVGIFAEQEDGRFRQTPMSDALRSDVPALSSVAVRPSLTRVKCPCGTATEIGADRAANVGVKRSTILACLVKNYGNWDKKRPVFLTSVSTTAKLTGRRGAAALDTLKKSQFNTIKIKYL